MTLTGPGGSGKTRLAVEVAGKLTDEFHEAIWFVSLADIADARLVADTILETLEVQRSATLTPLEQAIVFLNRQPSLLILDNCEHLLAEAARVVLALQTRVSSLSCLVTSRRRLALEGEHEFAVEPLPTPKEADTQDQFMHFASVQLFVDRAVVAFPNFRLKASNLLAVAQLCTRLEGIPLAIELAAARVGEFTPAQMLERISARFELLATASAEHPERHRSLWAAIDWSFDLLSPPLKRLFVRLSVFRGGCTADAVEAVCERPNAPEYLAQLRSHSLVTAEEACGEMRTLLLETLREYANELLEEAERSALAQHHADHFLKFIEAAEPNLIGSNQTEWLARIASELDNLRAALDWCGAPDDTETLLRFTGTMGTFWHVRGYFVEGKERLTLALTRGQATGNAVVRAKALNALGEMAWNLGEYSLAHLYLEEALELYRAVENRKSIAKALHNLGHVAADQNDHQLASLFYAESLAIWQELGDRQNIAWGLNRMGWMYFVRQDYVTSHALLVESLQLFRDLRDRRGIAWTLIHLGSLAINRNDCEDYAEARAVLEEGMALFHDLWETRGIAASLLRLGIIAFRQDDYVSARTCFKESLVLFQEIGHHQGIIASLQILGYLALQQGEYPNAHRIYCDILKASQNMDRAYADIIIGICLSEIAVFMDAKGLRERAAKLFGTLEAWHEQMSNRLTNAQYSWYAPACAKLQQYRFVTAWTKGRIMTPEQAIADALQPGDDLLD